jgi:L-ascorbate metabolism protein UlaG (beta-lactamase superfamily)
MNPLVEEMVLENVTPGSILIWWIGQSGFVLKTHKLTLYIDPYLSRFAERITQGKVNEHIRMSQPPMEPHEVINADLVFCTHDHADHIDPDGIPMISKASPKAQFLVPRCAMKTVLDYGIDSSRIHTLSGNDSLMIKGVEVFGIPAKHESFDMDEKDGFPYLSYLIRIDNMTIFHAGDTIPYDGQIEKIRPFNVDLAFVPINGRDDFRHNLQFEGNFDSKEAVEFAQRIGAKMTIPMHYNMFTLNTADVHDFVKIARQHGLNHLVMNHGEKIVFPVI